MLAVPRGSPLHAFFQFNAGHIGQFGSGPANIVHTAIGEKFDATPRQRSALALHTGQDGKDVSSGTDMHNAPQPGLSPTRFEQDTCAFDVRLGIPFCRDARMIEAPARW